jgi:glycosyltransferase involved in cell wall biosynthesis
MRPTGPFVSILTPTFNRRAFFEQCVRCVLNQDYPRDRIEWLILDDGTDPVEDLVPSGHPWVRYVRASERVALGEKRNRMHAMARGDILVYFDDDDYYPPGRISHSVAVLQANPTAMAAGCSELPIWYLDEDRVYVFGPYRSGHATCGTMAVRKALVDSRQFAPGATYAEEESLLAGWQVPLVQLDPYKTILCIAHDSNTIDKKRVRDDMERAKELMEPGTVMIRRSSAPGAKLVKDAASRAFYRAMQARLRG